MKIVIAVLALMPSLVSAQSNSAVYRPLPDTRCGYVDCIPPEPQPWPKPRPKPCKPWEGCHDPIVPLSSLKSKAASLTAAIADGKFDQAGAGLDGFYSGSASGEKGSEASAVAAGAWTVEPRTDAVLPKFKPAPREGRIKPLIERLFEKKEPEFKIVPVGLKDEAVKVAIPLVVEAVREAAKNVDKAVSDRLTAPDVERARQEYGGCRMKGTCSK